MRFSAAKKSIHCSRREELEAREANSVRRYIRVFIYEDVEMFTSKKQTFGELRDSPNTFHRSFYSFVAILMVEEKRRRIGIVHSTLRPTKVAMAQRIPQQEDLLAHSQAAHNTISSHHLTMTTISLQSRQLELTPAQKGLTSGLSIAAALILLLLGIWAYRKFHSNQTAPVAVEANEKAIEVEVQEESSQEDTDVEIAESSSEETYDKSISMCRSETMNSLDVHTCASGACDTCRKLQEPNFLGVKKLQPGTEGRIRSLPDRWWDNPLSYLQQPPEVMQTIASVSEDSEMFDSVLEGDESTLGESTFRYEEGVIRD